MHSTRFLFRPIFVAPKERNASVEANAKAQEKHQARVFMPAEDRRQVHQRSCQEKERLLQDFASIE